MKSGFLGGGGGGSRARAATREGGTASASTNDDDKKKPMPPPPSPPPASSATAPPSSRSLADCVDLLRGPTDERRLVGLLLATKVLPRGDAAALRSAKVAIGGSFLERLLLPLDGGGPRRDPGSSGTSFEASSSSSAPPDPERVLREAGQISLSLAVSSAFAWGLGPEVAGSEEFLKLAPRWCKVVASRGAVSALGGLSRAVDAFDPKAEEAATRDALDCLLAAALSGEEGTDAVAAAGGLSAAARALASASPEATAATSCWPPSLAASIGSPPRLPAWLGRAARLLAVLLSSPSRSRIVDASDVAAAAPALAALLAPSPESLVAGAAAAAAASGEGTKEDPAASQLDALAAFDALSSSPLLSSGAARAALAASAASSPWPSVALAGLSGLLRAYRAGPAVRHAALRVSALVASLVAEGSAGRASLLLLPAPPTPAETSGGEGNGRKNFTQSSDASPKEYLRVLCEVLRVESALLFRDAEEGDDPVPAPEAFFSVRPREGRGAEGESGGEGAAAAKTTDGASRSDSDDEDGGDALKPPPRLNVTQGDLDAAAGRWHENERGKKKETKTKAKTTEPAAARAERTLPSVLSLVEASLDALAFDAEAGARAAADRKGAPSGADDDFCETLGLRDGGADGGGGGGESQGVLFPDDVAVRAFSSLRDAVEQGLDFLEGHAPRIVAAESEGRKGGGGSPSASRPPPSPSERAARSLCPAAARCLGRLLADAPAAFGARPRALLPSLLSLRCSDGDDGVGTCGRFFLPVLSGALAFEEGEEGDARSISLDDGDAGAWLSAARKPDSLAGLAETLASAASEGAAAAAAPSGGGGDGEVAAAASVLSGLLPRPTELYLPLLSPLVPSLVSWAASRLGKEKGGEGGKEKEGARSDGRATATLLSTSNEVAVVLSLALASIPPSSPSTQSPAARAASCAALVACLRPGWVAWALMTKAKDEKKRKGGGRRAGAALGGGGGELMPKSSNDDDDDLEAMLLSGSGLAKESGGGGWEVARGVDDDEREEFSFLGADDEEGERSGVDGGHDERGWARALRAASLVADPSSSACSEALASAAVAAPWLRELLEEEGGDGGGALFCSPSSRHRETASALRMFLGSLRQAALATAERSMPRLEEADDGE